MVSISFINGCSGTQALAKNYTAVTLAESIVILTAFVPINDALMNRIICVLTFGSWKMFSFWISG